MARTLCGNVVRIHTEDLGVFLVAVLSFFVETFFRNNFRAGSPSCVDKHAAVGALFHINPVFRCQTEKNDNES